uniref:Uncharacterized protein n=1 Tax=mine drainage metagenome TaxID=410659 RepID=E6PYF0_9ZZZZ
MGRACVVIAELALWWLGDGYAGFCPCPPMPHRTRQVLCLGWGTVSGGWGGSWDFLAGWVVVWGKLLAQGEIGYSCVEQCLVRCPDTCPACFVCLRLC